MLKVLFFGDIVAKIGREAFLTELPYLKEKYSPNFIIVNGENSANGKGITSKIYNTYIDAGVQCITSGNHIFDNREVISQLPKLTSLIRPANYAKSVPGKTIYITSIAGMDVAVVNLLGQVFMPPIDSPFTLMEELLQNELKNTPVIIVDLHAEATSEKKAFAVHFSGRVSAVLGTHTHVPTADFEILNNHTGYITDIGMIGAKNSIIGMESEPIIQKFLTGMPEKFSPPETDSAVQFDYVYLEIDKNGKTSKIEATHDILEI